MATNSRSRLADLTAGLMIPSAEQQSTDAPKTPAMETKFPPVATGPARAKTGPGQMAVFRNHMLQTDEEAGQLRERLKRFEGAFPAVKLDPKKIRGTKWANRHAESFHTVEFLRLKTEIERAGGNVQPIMVRQISSTDEYEIAFGHRRHRACLELGIPVLAMIWQGELSDAELFVIMDRENRERADLSAYEQGQMYLRALEEGLYPSVRQLSESLGVSHTWVNKTIQVANLPAPVVEAFASPLDIQPKHAKDLLLVLESDRKGVLKRAEKIRGKKLKPAAVLARLLGSPDEGGPEEPIQLKTGTKVFGSCQFSKDGGAVLKLVPTAVTDADMEQLTAAFEQAIRQLRKSSAAGS